MNTNNYPGYIVRVLYAVWAMKCDIGHNVYIHQSAISKHIPLVTDVFL